MLPLCTHGSPLGGCPTDLLTHWMGQDHTWEADPTNPVAQIARDDIHQPRKRSPPLTSAVWRVIHPPPVCYHWDQQPAQSPLKQVSSEDLRPPAPGRESARHEQNFLDRGTAMAYLANGSSILRRSRPSPVFTSGPIADVSPLASTIQRSLVSS